MNQPKFMKILIKCTHKIILKSPYWLSNLISCLDVFDFCLDTPSILKALDKSFRVTWQFGKYQNLCFLHAYKVWTIPATS